MRHSNRSWRRLILCAKTVSYATVAGIAEKKAWSALDARSRLLS